jgi:hypothetical protein
VLRAAQSAGVDASRLGEVTGDRMVVAGLLDVPVDGAVDVSEGRLPRTFSALSGH